MDDVPGVACRSGLENEDRSFLVGYGSVLHTSRHDDELSGPYLDRSVSKLYSESTLEAEEQLILVVMMMPHECPFELGKFDFLTIQFTDHPRAPMLGDKLKLLSQNHFFHM
jgi:hypothetical protein